MSKVKSSSGPPPINISSAMERIGGDESFLHELIDIYIEDFIQKYGILREAIVQEDFNSIARIGHSLRGSSGNLSLNGLHETCTLLELSGTKKDIEQSRSLFIRLNEEFEKLKDFLPVEKRKLIDHKWVVSSPEGAFFGEDSGDDENSLVRILAADDSVPNQILLKHYAAHAGYSMDIAPNGREAVEFFRRNSYSIILMDIHMPEMDGFEALESIRRFEHENILPRTPIIALTGSTFQEEGTTCLDAGFDDFVEKSSIGDSLTRMIKKHVQIARNEEENPQLDEAILPLIPEYIENRKKDAVKIGEALENEEFNSIEDLGHKMKGSGKCYGFEKISMLGHQIEISAKQKNIREIERAASKIHDYLSHLKYDRPE
jgi:CheY-like chemotaxis protein